MKINLQILDEQTQKFLFEKSVNIPFIPRKEEKFVHQDKQSHNNVYQVHDVFYSENNVEILLIKIATVPEYYQSLGLHLF